MFQSEQIPYFTLMAAIFLTMWPVRKVQLAALAIFCVSLLSAYSGRLIDLSGLSVVLIFGFVSTLAASSAQLKKGSLILVVWIIMALLMAGHKWPGFQNLLVLDKFRFSEKALPYTMYFNFDKPLIGFYFLYYLSVFQNPTGTFGKNLEWILRGCLVIPILMVLGVATAYVEWDPKWVGSIFVVWALRNFFFTCLAEEALFRGVLFEALGRFRLFKGRPMAIVTVTAMLFGAAHFAGGISYVALSTVAGLGYGWVRLRSGNIVASATLHLLVNSTHLLLFTYPALDH